jgi:hypothetical protein
VSKDLLVDGKRQCRVRVPHQVHRAPGRNVAEREDRSGGVGRFRSTRPSPAIAHIWSPLWVWAPPIARISNTVEIDGDGAGARVTMCFERAGVPLTLPLRSNRPPS